MDWKNCIKKRIAKEIKVDLGLIKSLIKTSKNKLEVEEGIKLNEVTASSKISLAYDSIREALEALSIKRGYKIYNHECYTHFLKEILNKSNEGDRFDNLRKIRNAINYYGKNISKEEAKEILGKIKNLRKEIIKLI